MTARYGLALAAALAAGCSRPPNHTPLQPQPRQSTRSRILPNRDLTPGDSLDVAKADICTPGYTKKIRNVPPAVKREAFATYGEEQEAGECCEVDHLVPLELGGSNRIRNLWPQRYDGKWNAKVKDRLEGRLHRLVCSGDLDLATAQRLIAQDWVSAYERFEGEPHTGRHGAKRR